MIHGLVYVAIFVSAPFAWAGFEKSHHENAEMRLFRRLVKKVKSVTGVTNRDSV
jgi:hypothetical protein